MIFTFLGTLHHRHLYADEHTFENNRLHAEFKKNHLDIRSRTLQKCLKWNTTLPIPSRKKRLLNGNNIAESSVKREIDTLLETSSVEVASYGKLS